MKLATTIIFSLLFCLNAFAVNCRTSYRFESFFLGAGVSFGEDIDKPDIVDNVCWNLGMRFANRVLDNAREEREEDDCFDAFDEGVEQGLEARQSDINYPQACYNIGLNFGFSHLANSAREGDSDFVGKECVKEYDKGYQAGLNNRPITVRPDTKLAYCYRVGYADARFSGIAYP